MTLVTPILGQQDEFRVLLHPVTGRFLTVENRRYPCCFVFRPSLNRALRSVYRIDRSPSAPTHALFFAR